MNAMMLWLGKKWTESIWKLLKISANENKKEIIIVSGKEALNLLFQFIKIKARKLLDVIVDEWFNMGN